MGVNAWRRNGRGRALSPEYRPIHGTLLVVFAVVGEGLAVPGFVTAFVVVGEGLAPPVGAGLVYPELRRAPPSKVLPLTVHTPRPSRMNWISS